MATSCDQAVFKGVKTFKNEWAEKYDESVFKVDIDPGNRPRLWLPVLCWLSMMLSEPRCWLSTCCVGKIPHFIYYDAAGAEITREKYEDKSAEEVAAVCEPCLPRTCSVGYVVLCCWRLLLLAAAASRDKCLAMRARMSVYFQMGAVASTMLARRCRFWPATASTPVQTIAVATTSRRRSNH